ncbi:MAG: dienelactone hydrolase family protein, partial [Hyphomicrobiaceae bacterium]
MGKHIKLKASDGFELDAYRADPAGKPKGGLIVIQEIFGVNEHIRAVCDRYAADGYLCVAPALQDRAEKDFETGYTPDDIAKAREVRG